jgi:hypothetical protein
MHKRKAHLKLSKHCAVSLILLIFQIQFIHAESLTEAKSNSLWQLWAKPRICVIPSDRRVCKMETDIAWAGFEQTDICLSSSNNKTVLQCWRNALDGHLWQKIITEEPITYWLNRAGENEILIKTQIRIISFPKKQVRRRRRHIWSLL